MSEDQQPAGTADAGDPVTNAYRRRLSGWKECTDVGGGQATPHRGYSMGHKALSADGSAGRSRGHRLTALL